MANRNITLKNKKFVAKFDTQKQSKDGLINLIEHEIMIHEGAIPCRQKSNKKKPKVIKALYEKIDSLIEKGYIVERNSDSEWLSQPNMIKNKDGDWTFCVNYSKLNSCCYKWNYPVHNQWKILQNLRNVYRISVFKIQDAFHQIKLKHESRKYTAFEVQGRGVYEWVRMPYGLRGASAIYSCFIDQIKKSILEEINLLHPNIHADDKIFVCLETWIVVSDTIEEHTILIEAVFKGLEDRGLKIDPKHSDIAKEDLDYFGYDIGYNELYISRDSIKSILNFPRPKNLREIRQFNSMVHRYHSVLKNIAIIQAPLNKFCAADAVWQWTELEEKSFQNTKATVFCVNYLSMIDPNLPFRLYTYVMCGGIGAELMQYDEEVNCEYLITYVSKSFNEVESKYSKVEQQVFSVVRALSKVRCFIGKSECEVFANRSVLSWYKSKKRMSRRLNQWAIILSKYNFTLRQYNTDEEETYYIGELIDEDLDERNPY